MWVFPREHIDLNYQASSAPSRIAAVVYVKGRKTGLIQRLYASFTSFTTDRSILTARFDSEITEEGEVVGAAVATFGTNLKRGQFLCSVTVGTLQEARTICQGYLYDGRWLKFGMNEDPFSGRGYISWVEVFHDRAGNAAALDFALAATNAFRKVYGLAWYYHCSSDVANRILNAPAVANLGGATPTGFTTTGNNALFWNTGANITLDADQEGAHISYSPEAKDGRTVTNDQGVQSIGSTAGAPTPWPLLVTEDEVGVIRFPAITLGEVLDRHSAYVLMEEWIIS